GVWPVIERAPHAQMAAMANSWLTSPAFAFTQEVGASQLAAALPFVQQAQRMQDASSWLTGPAFKLVDTAKLTLPLLPDLTKWIGEVSGYAQSAALMAQPLVLGPAANLWAQLGPTLELLRRHWLPANLRELDDVSVTDLTSVADDGITLYAVPRAAIAKRILAAPDRAARRRILGGELPRILDDCEGVLDECVRPETRGPVEFTRKAIAAARAGHLEAAQSLVANTLDTVRAQRVEHADRALIQGRKRASREDLDGLSVRRFMVLAPIWHAYSSYTPGQADPIPRTFNRHVNAHAVNARQFNRPNMAQGVMLLTALVALLNDL
ncbi:MAG TPA: hypothetical protein VMV41_06240, partial [Cellulomonadaceae bacterium]|nr:hypothetical protein [Cellulomonadaceae bacterium]